MYYKNLMNLLTWTYTNIRIMNKLTTTQNQRKINNYKIALNHTQLTIIPNMVTYRGVQKYLI